MPIVSLPSKMKLSRCDREGNQNRRAQRMGQQCYDRTRLIQIFPRHDMERNNQRSEITQQWLCRRLFALKLLAFAA
ncbi:hypothetical protein RB195_001258 [Necator americanus]|uniref:Uncharacterized protein n=1 Tax=Necator americanus TaxID=51031 RepID=A0ABR1DGF1_NECAM